MRLRCLSQTQVHSIAAARSTSRLLIPPKPCRGLAAPLEIPTLAGPSHVRTFASSLVFRSTPHSRHANSKPVKVIEIPETKSRYFVRRFFGLCSWLVVGIVFWDQCLSVALVEGGSMSPTFNPEFPTKGRSASRDLVLLDKLAPVKAQWQVGDVVVFKSPINPDRIQIKRILALEGDVVRFRDATPGAPESSTGWKRVRIKPGHCWVEGDSSIHAPLSAEGGLSQEQKRLSGLGHAATASSASSALRPVFSAPRPPSPDNPATSLGHDRDMSKDSRHFGPVPLALLTAKITLILAPSSRAGPVPSHRPGYEASPAMEARRAMMSWRDGEAEGAHSEGGVLTRFLPAQWQAPQDRQEGDDSLLSPYNVVPKGFRGKEMQIEVIKEGDGDGDREIVARIIGGEPNDSGSGSPSRGSTTDEERRREYFNSISRGGRLGDSAERV